MLPIAEIIRTMRREKDMTQDELAQALGVSYQAVSRWENSQTYPDIELLPKLAAVLGTTTDKLLGADEEAREKEILELSESCHMAARTEKDPLKLHRIRMDAFRRMPPEHSSTLHLASDICRDLVYKNILPREEALPIVREMCALLIQQTQQQHYRNWGLAYIYVYEDEERLDDWQKYVCDYTRADLLEQRYLHRQEYDRHNLQMQKNLYSTLMKLFPIHAHMVFEDDARDAQAGITAAECTLQIMDLFRDSADSTDLFLRNRAWTFLYLGKYKFVLGDRDGGYEAMEEALRLCESLFTAPLDLKRTCSHPLFNLLSVTALTNLDGEDYDSRSWDYGVFYSAFHAQEGQWKPFSPYLEEDRYQKILERYHSFDPEPHQIRDQEQIQKLCLQSAGSGKKPEN